MRWPCAAWLALLCGGALAAEPQVAQITWLVGDTLAVRNPGGVERPSDRMIGWLTKRLDRVAHHRIPANAKRSWRLIAAGEQVCHAGAVRLAERERLAYFSNTWLLPPVHVITSAAGSSRLPLAAAGRVDLVRLLNDRHLHGMAVQGRSYGVEVDALLAEAGQGAALQYVTAGDFGSNIMPMLLRGRIDYALEYPNALAAFAESQPDADRLTALPINGVTTPVISGVACPRTPWGLAAIRLIDRELGTPEGAALLRESLTAQLSAGVTQSYRTQLDSFFQQRSRPTPAF